MTVFSIIRGNNFELVSFKKQKCFATDLSYMIMPLTNDQDYGSNDMIFD